jgi:hypothetical protein
MELENFKECINIWIKPSTWHTNHPLDTERFHNALHQIFIKNGTKIEPEKFSKLLSQALVDQYPKINKDFLDKEVKSAETTYDVIRSYLFDISK